MSALCHRADAKTDIGDRPVRPNHGHGCAAGIIGADGYRPNAFLNPTCATPLG